MFKSHDIFASYPRYYSTSQAFVFIAVQTIFSQITPETTKRQYEEAQAALLALCQRFEAQVKQQGLFHYQAAHGSLHTCVRDFYLDLSARLTNLAIMHPEPPPPVPPPEPAYLTDEQVLGLLETQRRHDTAFGEERDEDETA